MSYEKFIGKVWKSGDSLVVTIPSAVAKYGGYVEGDTIKVMSKKELERKLKKRKQKDRELIKNRLL